MIDGEQLLIGLDNFEFEVEINIRAEDTIYSSRVDISFNTLAATFTGVSWLQEIGNSPHLSSSKRKPELLGTNF